MRREKGGAKGTDPLRFSNTDAPTSQRSSESGAPTSRDRKLRLTNDRDAILRRIMTWTRRFSSINLR